MVTNITPSYYAANTPNTEFLLTGTGFDTIPSDAVGIYANDNNDPLEHRYSTNSSALFDIVEKTSTTMRVVCREPLDTHSSNFLGGIVSLDRSAVYWINETRPLP